MVLNRLRATGNPPPVWYNASIHRVLAASLTQTSPIVRDIGREIAA